MYTDLSINAEKVIDLGFLLSKLKTDGYTAFALDYEFSDNTIFKKNEQNIPKVEDVSIHRRATFVVDSPASLHPLGQQTVPYDILAVKPQNQKMFHTLCTEYDVYDILTFDLGVKMPYMLKRNPVYEAIRKGKFFQICYDSMFQEDKRVICMTNMVNIIKATNGKNLIISSRCANHSNHRTPFDIAALMISLGMNKNMALGCLKQNMNQVIRNCQHRRFLKGAIQEVPVEVGLKLGKKIQKHRLRLKEMQKKIGQKKDEGDKKQ